MTRLTRLEVPWVLPGEGDDDPSAERLEERGATTIALHATAADWGRLARVIEQIEEQEEESEDPGKVAAGIVERVFAAPEGYAAEEVDERDPTPTAEVWRYRRELARHLLRMREDRRGTRHTAFLRKAYVGLITPYIEERLDPWVSLTSFFERLIVKAEGGGKRVTKRQTAHAVAWARSVVKELAWEDPPATVALDEHDLWSFIEKRRRRGLTITGWPVGLIWLPPYDPAELEELEEPEEP